MLYLLNGTSRNGQDRQKEILIECIANVTTELLGKGAATALSFYIRLNEGEINIRIVHERLQNMFGEGAHVIEKSILEELCRRLGAQFDEASALDVVSLLEEIIE